MHDQPPPQAPPAMTGSLPDWRGEVACRRGEGATAPPPQWPRTGARMRERVGVGRGRGGGGGGGGQNARKCSGAGGTRRTAPAVGVSSGAGRRAGDGKCTNARHPGGGDAARGGCLVHVAVGEDGARPRGSACREVLNRFPVRHHRVMLRIAVVHESTTILSNPLFLCATVGPRRGSPIRHGWHL